jgi:hypothetical protein
MLEVFLTFEKRTFPLSSVLCSTHASVICNGPSLTPNCQRRIEKVLGIVLLLDLQQFVIVRTIESLPPVSLFEISFVDIDRLY